MSFPKIESHYRREQTSKFYFESQLSIAKMYELYEEKCRNSEPVRTSVKISM
jgi:hypothetical protein